MEQFKTIIMEWKYEIPIKWSVSRFSNIFRQKINPNHIEKELLSVYLNEGVIRTCDSDGMQVHKPSESLSKYQLVEVNDFVMNNQQAWRGSVGVSNYEGIISPAYYVFSIDKSLRPCFANYLLRSRVMVDQYVVSSKGVGSIQRDIYYPWLKNAVVPIPLHTEQDAIVAFLDKKMTMIDEYIANKKNLIQKLIEYKKAIVNEAVTKGINRKVEMKDSGVDWLGCIPAHWDISKLGKLLTMVSIKHRQDCQLLSVVREKGVIIRNVDNIEENHNFIPEDLSNYKYVRANQFVINKMKAWQGSYGVSNYEGIVSPAYYVMDLHFENKAFFNLAIRSKVYVNFFAQYSDGIRVGQWDLSKEKMKTIPFFIPSATEQNEIVDYVQRKHQEINRKISYVEKQIELMQEYRTRLISDAVTGKTCVL